MIFRVLEIIVYFFFPHGARQRDCEIPATVTSSPLLDKDGDISVIVLNIVDGDILLFIVLF